MTHSAIIVGGGPAGALLAYILVSRGVPVTLIERQSDFAREFRGEGLSPSGQQMFREAGLWDDFEALPHTKFEAAELFFKRRRFAAVQLGQVKDLSPRWVSQPAMLEMLVEKASAYPNFTFRRGVRVTGPVMRDGRVVGVELSCPEGHERLIAAYVFACDGRFSVLRKAAGLDRPRSPEFFDIVWCKLPLPGFYKARRPGVRGYIGNGHLGLFIPSYDGLLQIGWVIRKGAYKDFRAKGIEHWLEQMARHVSADMAEHLREHAGDTIHPFLLDVVCDCYDGWSVPGLTLAGDAAHPMSPVGAQGINIALRDSVVAANHFVPLLLAGASPAELDGAAAAFRAERIREIEPIQAMQRRGPKILLSEGPLPGVIVWAVRWLLRLGVLGWLAARFDLGPKVFLYGVTEVELTV
jgi:2-polyprenyl-6-methoxyphenol hydroxylase-like FAD-dependent oxidoreductase